MKRILVIVLVAMALAGCVAKQPQINPDAATFKEEYESLNGVVSNDHIRKSVDISEDNVFHYVLASDVDLMINSKETFVVYFGFDTCPWCRSVIEALDSVAKEEGVDAVYYVDIKDIRDTVELDENNNPVCTSSGDPDYAKLVKDLKEVLSDYTLHSNEGDCVDAGEKRIYAPNIVGVKDGRAVIMKTGIPADLEDPYEPLTDEMRQDSMEQFRSVFEAILGK